MGEEPVEAPAVAGEPAAEGAGYDAPEDAAAAEQAAMATVNKLDVQALPIRQYLVGPSRRRQCSPHYPPR
jgi:hypothetical protein